MNDWAPLTSLIEKRTGMDIITLGGLTAIQRIALLSQSVSDCPTLEAWLESLHRNTDLWQEFLHRLIVPETFFFRYPESYGALTDWVSQQTQRPLRILSLPCSTGEEAYSIAISLHEAGVPSADYTVTAMDIDSPSVDFARRACFPRSNSFRGMDPQRQKRYFQSFPDHLQLVATIKEQIEFHTRSFWDTNLLDTPYDVVFCRNLLIYFSAQKQIDALHRLQSLLHPKGLLFLGPSEVPVANQHGWRSSGISMAFACHKPSARTTPFLPPPLSAAPALPIRHLPPPSLPTLPPARPPASPSPVAIPAPTPSLQDIRTLADRGAVTEAQAVLDQFLQSHPPCADAYALAGLLAEAADRPDLAETWFRKALYLVPHHTEALTHLAWLLHAEGRVQASRQLIDRVERHQSS